MCAVIRAAIPMKVQKSGGHPAKRTFQAIRIELNRELEVLKDSLDDMIDLLNDGGRICVITFHSSKGTVVSKPMVPSEEELKTNKRSKSARLRVFERKEQ